MLSHWTTREVPIPEFKTKSLTFLKAYLRKPLIQIGAIWRLDLFLEVLYPGHHSDFSCGQSHVWLQEKLGDMALLSIHGTPHHLGTPALLPQPGLPRSLVKIASPAFFESWEELDKDPSMSSPLSSGGETIQEN